MENKQSLKPPTSYSHLLITHVFSIGLYRNQKWGYKLVPKTGITRAAVIKSPAGNHHFPTFWVRFQATFPGFRNVSCA